MWGISVHCINRLSTRTEFEAFKVYVAVPNWCPAHFDQPIKWPATSDELKPFSVFSTDSRVDYTIRTELMIIASRRQDDLCRATVRGTHTSYSYKGDIYTMCQIQALLVEVTRRQPPPPLPLQRLPRMRFDADVRTILTYCCPFGNASDRAGSPGPYGE